MRDEIVIRGAREHNLKNLNLTIPRDKFGQRQIKPCFRYDICGRAAALR